MLIAGFEVNNVTSGTAQVGCRTVTRAEVEALLVEMNARPAKLERRVGSLIACEGYDSYVPSVHAPEFVEFHLKRAELYSSGNLRVAAIDKGWALQPTVEFCLPVDAAQALVEFLQTLLVKAQALKISAQAVAECR